MSTGFPPFARGSDTSEAAAYSIANDTSRLRLLVASAIKSAGSHGFTCDEVEVTFNMRHQTASARINELHNAGVIYDSTRRRSTRSGRNAVVWVMKI